MRFLCIGGFWSKQNPIWLTIIEAFGSLYPHAEFVVEEEEMLQPYQTRRILSSVDRMGRHYDDGVATFIIAHSFGYYFALSIEQRFEHSKVIGMTTICSPHAIPFWYLPPVPQPIAPLLTIGGVYDYVVPHWFTRHPREVAHVLMPIDHWRDVARNPMHALQIAIETRYFLFSRNSRT